MQNKPFLAVLITGLTLCATAAFGQRTQPVAQTTTVQVPGEAIAVLKYRNPAEPLSIGEMSLIQAKKLDEDFLKKMGYTSEATAPTVSTPTNGTEFGQPQPKPMATVTALGIYGPSMALRADISINGEVRSVKGGESFPGGISIVSVSQRAVQVMVQGRKKGRATAIHSVAVGEALEFPL